MTTDNYALVLCAVCGYCVQVPRELLGDTKPEDVVGYRCDACDEYEQRADPDDGPDWDDDLWGDCHMDASG